MRGKRRLSTLADVNVTNLVDVTLVLLIIFILVAPFIREGIEIKTPEVTDPKPLQMDRSILIEIDKDAKVFLNHDQVVVEDIGPEVFKLRQAMPEASVLIEADSRVAYGTFVKVTDLIRQAGITDISLVTQKAKASTKSK